MSQLLLPFNFNIFSRYRINLLFYSNAALKLSCRRILSTIGLYTVLYTTKDANYKYLQVVFVFKSMVYYTTASKHLFLDRCKRGLASPYLTILLPKIKTYFYFTSAQGQCIAYPIKNLVETNPLK